MYACFCGLSCTPIKRSFLVLQQGSMGPTRLPRVTRFAKSRGVSCGPASKLPYYSSTDSMPPTFIPITARDRLWLLIEQSETRGAHILSLPPSMIIGCLSHNSMVLQCCCRQFLYAKCIMASSQHTYNKVFPFFSGSMPDPEASIRPIKHLAHAVTIDTQKPVKRTCARPGLFITKNAL